MARGEPTSGLRMADESGVTVTTAGATTGTGLFSIGVCTDDTDGSGELELLHDASRGKIDTPSLGDTRPADLGVSPASSRLLALCWVFIRLRRSLTDLGVSTSKSLSSTAMGGFVGVVAGTEATWIGCAGATGLIGGGRGGAARGGGGTAGDAGVAF